MAIFTELEAQLAVLRELVGEDAEPSTVGELIARLSDDQVVEIIGGASELIRGAERLRIVAAGVAASRSTRDAGHSGLAQSRGHRNATGLVQELTGSTKSEAQRHVRLGESILEGGSTGSAGVMSDPATNGSDSSAGTGMGEPSEGGAAEGDAEYSGPASWHSPLDAALLRGTVSAAQHDAILRGLGEPPADGDTGETPVDAWARAAEQLIETASACAVEELARTARTVRDRLDPEGADQRYRARYERRSFRRWTDADGQQRGSFAFDDEGALWIDTIIDSAMRPRRGGPRFVDAQEREQARALSDDPRTNDQLAYDLIVDVLRAGALTDVTEVFGTRQAGVRLVQVVNSDNDPADVAHAEDQLVTFPSWVAQQHMCDTGTVPVTVDSAGNPLDVGREHRLFTPKQRIALAVRDGGCRWNGCDRPASYCEAHHIDHYSQGGRTDIDRGLLLCRFHHMALHSGGWWITRDGKGDFVLRHKTGETSTLKPRLALTYAWAGIDPPPKRFRPAAA